MPVGRPMAATFCMISFMGAWRNFLRPRIILHRPSLFTVPVGLNLFMGGYRSDYGTEMAGTLLAVGPVALLFMVVRKVFIAGQTRSSVRGWSRNLAFAPNISLTDISAMDSLCGSAASRNDSNHLEAAIRPVEATRPRLDLTCRIPRPQAAATAARRAHIRLRQLPAGPTHRHLEAATS